jgi:predicted transcriptional regulator
MDVLEIARAFDVSFEQACHRLTTLRRPGLEGVPLHFLRVDIAGNISKRFSASGLTLPRYGGACPRWIVHHAFAMPGRVLTEVASLPDGETYLFIARADPPQRDGGVEETTHAVMIGASIAYAGRFAYADTLNLASPRVAVPVGVTCRLCPRDDCAQRAFDRFQGFPWSGAVKAAR